MTGNLLRALMSFSKDSRAFNLSDVAEDSDPVAYTNMQHFFANYYNQLLTILASWSSEATNFTHLLETDSQLAYTG